MTVTSISPVIDVFSDHRPYLTPKYFHTESKKRHCRDICGSLKIPAAGENHSFIITLTQSPKKETPQNGIVFTIFFILFYIFF
ncbi:MAG: hypothetical protein EBR30_04585 [Cytophagia bacterium]|nr:hypothetical protein [Cytophagia bacterium]